MGESAAPSLERSARLTLAMIVAFVRALGPLRRPLAHAIGGMWFRALPRPVRERAADNHRRLHPTLRPGSARVLARTSYQEYVAMILDAIWAEHLGVEAIRRSMRIIGVPNLEAADGGGILAISHFGNWDMAACGAVALGRHPATVMAPIGSAWMTAMVELSRARKGLELYSPEQAARGLARTLRHGGLVALMVDVPEAGPTVAVRFCGGLVRFSSVPARLAAATGKPIVPVACWREAPGWVLEFFAPIWPSGAGEAETMAAIAAVLEPRVSRHPEQWYPFHDVYEATHRAG